jgi:hypothetical protein
VGERLSRVVLRRRPTTPRRREPSGASLGRFERTLAPGVGVTRAQRPAGLGSDSPDLPDLPRGFRAEDFLPRPPSDEFVSLAEAAARMDLTPEFVLALVEDGTLEARGRSLGSLRVRPEIVSILRVVRKD